MSQRINLQIERDFIENLYQNTIEERKKIEEHQSVPTEVNDELDFSVELEEENKLEERILQIAASLGLKAEYLRSKIMANGEDMLSSVEIAMAAGVLPHEILASINTISVPRPQPSTLTSISPPAPSVASVTTAAKRKSLYDPKLLDEPLGDAVPVTKLQFRMGSKRVVRSVCNELPVCGLYDLVQLLFHEVKRDIQIYTVMPTRTFDIEDCTPIGSLNLHGTAIQVREV